ncbi:hypothetical protein Zmor_024976 [Zophobas morio]|uniref:Uncharacterized protein n=1 Tax=Zophobas morio TaxID=2755281 RepID=A0AA38HSY0_9CUCU|nr:hypothetical protein Zmor_024976 [Zophobas morio]
MADNFTHGPEMAVLIGDIRLGRFLSGLGMLEVTGLGKRMNIFLVTINCLSAESTRSRWHNKKNAPRILYYSDLTRVEPRVARVVRSGRLIFFPHNITLTLFVLEKRADSSDSRKMLSSRIYREIGSQTSANLFVVGLESGSVDVNMVKGGVFADSIINDDSRLNTFCFINEVVRMETCDVIVLNWPIQRRFLKVSNELFITL